MIGADLDQTLVNIFVLLILAVGGIGLIALWATDEDDYTL
jgi:hypothetical protein